MLLYSVLQVCTVDAGCTLYLHQLYCYNLSYFCCCRLYSVLASTVLLQLVLFLLLQDVQCACINCIDTTCLISVAAGCTVGLHQLYCYNLSYFCCCRLYSVLASTVLLQLVLLLMQVVHTVAPTVLQLVTFLLMHSVLASTVLLQLVLFLLLQVVQCACINCIVTTCLISVAAGCTVCLHQLY